MDEKALIPVRSAAIKLLSLREHSEQELLEKLSKSFNRDLIFPVLLGLKEQGLQSDERFAGAFVRMRSRQGKGPQLIGAELKRRGVESFIYMDLLSDHSEWNELALHVKCKKFGQSSSKDIKEKAKQMRFLASRGFNSVNIQYALTRSL